MLSASNNNRSAYTKRTIINRKKEKKHRILRTTLQKKLANKWSNKKSKNQKLKMSLPIAYLVRKEIFSAAHRLHRLVLLLSICVFFWLLFDL